MYAGHDSGLVGLKSPVGRTSGTTSQRQLRSKHPWEGNRRQGTDTNRIEGRDWPGEGAMDSEAQNLCGDRHGKFSATCRAALSLIPGGPTNGQQWLWTLRSVRKEGWESAEGIVAGANL